MTTIQQAEQTKVNGQSVTLRTVERWGHMAVEAQIEGWNAPLYSLSADGALFLVRLVTKPIDD